jgi:hypothetical protein
MLVSLKAKKREKNVGVGAVTDALPLVGTNS